MSGSTIGGVVGAVVGSFIPGVGTQIGWMVGSAIGGYVDPDVIKGPRLTDATVQTSTVGGIITDGDGAFPTTGNLTWWTDLKETKKKERSGKGGPVQVTYHYSRSYAIGICLGPIAGIKTIKRNGKVVYESGTNVENEYVDGNGSPISEAVATAIRANNAKFLDKCTIYLGTEDQMPDPTIEAVEGVGNVSPFRGLAYIVVHDDDLTDLGGAVPQYEFVVVTEGTEVEHDCERDVFFAAPAPDGALYTTEDPNNWSNANKVETGLDSVDMTYAKEGLIFAFGTLDGVGAGRVSNNSGFSWNDVGNMPDDTVNSMLWVSDANRYLLSTQVSGLFAVTSGGALTSLPAEMPRTYYGIAAIGLTVIAARTGGVERSIDGGSTWSAVSLPAGADVHYVCASGSAFVAFYATGGISSSPTGAPGTWTDRTNPAGFETASGLAFGNNTFVAVVGAGIVIRSGDNGATWVISSDTVSGEGVGQTQNLYYDAVGELFVWLGNTAAAFTSYDADVWTETATAGVGGIEYVTSLSDGLPPGVEIPDAPGFYVMPDGTVRTNCTGGTIDRDRIVLGTVVAKLCRSVGLQDEDFDVSELTDLIDGHKRAADSTPGGYISQLSQTHFFDPGEWDGQLWFKKRGGDPAFVLDLNDLAERDGAAIEERTIQEPELPRKITVGYIDPGAGFSVNTQAWERRAATVEAKAETSFEAAICITADEAAGIAEKRGKVAWSEGDEFKFHLPYEWSYLTPTDVGTITDRRNATHRIRLMQVEEEGGVLMVQASKDRARNYVSTAIGVLPRPPVINTPGLIGSTILEILNIPIWNDGDDELGVYVAARGALPGWTGAELQLSSNGGATGDPVAQLTESATIGYTLTGLAAAFAEAPSLQTVDVWLPDPPESVDYATLLRYYNRAVIGDEVIQYQAVTSLGSGQYRLSGLLRGRYATAPVQQAVGVRFVLLDSAVKFLPMQRWMLGQPLQVRAVSYNTSPDAYAWIPLQIDTAQSQTEWAPFMVRANVVGADLVVTWVGRGRLGVDSNAYHSKYFAGYRITYDDGSGPVSYDITGTTHTLAGGASGGPRSITVAALNSITGAGPASEEITA